jgi:flagellar basal body-associated protein FliL
MKGTRKIMKITRTIGVIIAAVAILLTVTAGVTYLLYRFSKEKAYNEKWEDYIDCGMA